MLFRSDDTLEPEVADYAASLGVLQIERQKVPVEGVDMRLTLGLDFETFVRTNPSDGLIAGSTTTTAAEQ